MINKRSVAESNLGIMYETGQGVTQNINESIKWYCLAGDKDDVTAQHALGTI